MNVAFPFAFDHRGRTAEPVDHVRELIEQLLFTTPGERVNRPDFGSGVLQMVFQPNAPDLAGVTQHVIQGALQQWLGDVVIVERVDVRNDDARLEISLTYLIRRTQERRRADFSRPRP
jgi:phage baseplate assembly protein W